MENFIFCAASIEQSDLSSKLLRSIKKFEFLMTCHSTLDFIVWPSKSSFRKILIIVGSKLSNRTKDGYDSKSCGEDIFTDCVFSISSPELKRKLNLKSCENEDTNIYWAIIRHLFYYTGQKGKPFRTELRDIFLFSFVHRNQTWNMREHFTKDSFTTNNSGWKN